MDKGNFRCALYLPGMTDQREIFADGLGLGVLSGLGEGCVPCLIVEALLVDELGVDGFAGQVRRAVDESDDFLARALAVLGDVCRGILEDGLEQTGGRFAVRCGEVLLGVDVCRVLVLITLLELRHGLDLVQQAAKEHCGRGDASGVHLADGLQPDLAGGGGQHVVAHAARVETLGVCDHKLALCLERLEGCAQLLCGCRGDRSSAQANEGTLDAIILFGRSQCAHGIDDGADLLAFTEQAHAG